MLRLTLPLRIMLACVVFAVLGLLVFSYVRRVDCSNIQRSASCSRILFVGNSYTFVNDLPHTFAALAKAGRHTVEIGMAAEGGSTLSDHAGSPQTLSVLQSSKWDFVILQEQSQLPSLEPYRIASMYPAARLLVRRIRAGGATPLFFLTWAHRDGWPEYDLNGYEPMQLQITQAYVGIAQELGVRIAPVGQAWRVARRQHPALDLWQADGSHPNEQGTYLAACVFYATLFGQSPEGLTYTADLPKETAHLLQF
ncbi:MAG: hypothetical protein M3R61_20665 [Chloroflexota bacterium]|nr:hypothetical protein [Chloroflexota bacterium]